MPRRIRVEIPRPEAEAAYDVILEPDLLKRAGRYIAEECPAHLYAVITDSRVAELYGKRLSESLDEAGLASIVLEFPAGEWNKTREIWFELTDGLLRAGAGRDTAVIALGGGVVGDLAGFVAATYMRGVPLIQVPTTLLAMVDSSVGGKTGVDTGAGKNLVGAFHQPELVLVDPAVLSTLSGPQFASGLAEAVKHGAILDAGYYAWLGEVGIVAADRDVGTLTELIRRSVEIKAKVVSRDERESGYRRVLNFGHTLGHALETLGGYSLLHGEAVAIGMVLEAAIGIASGVTRHGVDEDLRELLLSLRLPVELEADVDIDRLLKVLELDKKRAGGQMRFSLIEEIGRIAESADGGWTHVIREETVREVLAG